METHHHSYATGSTNATRPPIPSFRFEQEEGGSNDNSSSPESISKGSGDTSFLSARRPLDFDEPAVDGVQDDESSQSSSSSSSSDEEEEESMTLLEKVSRNQQRNARFLESLHVKYKGGIPDVDQRHQPQQCNMSKDEDTEPELEDTPRGMLLQGSKCLFRSMSFAESDSFSNRIQKILSKYPHRTKQIRQLTAPLHAAIGQVETNSQSNTTDYVYVPPPLLVTGARGSGKTSIICDIVEALDHPKITTKAYVNVATLDPSSMERLVSDAYHQLNATDTSQRIHRSKKKRKRILTAAPTTGTLDPSVPSRNNGEEPVPDDENVPPDTPNGVIPEGQLSVDETLLKERRVQPKRIAKQTNEFDAATNDLTSKSKAPLPASSSGGAASRDSVELSNSILMAFGRSLQPVLGVESGRCGYLVLDRAERLLTLSAKKSQGTVKTNFLAELLLLPRVMRLNLSVILITSHCSLDGTRLNNTSSIERSLATVSTGTHPVCIQFPSYRGNKIITEILSTSTNSKLIFGKSTGDDANGFKCVFLNSLVQFVSDSTRDIGDFIRLGRSLWPFFISPLSTDQIEKTMELISRRRGEELHPDGDYSGDIKTYLSQNFLSRVGKIRGDLVVLPLDSPMVLSDSIKDSLPRSRFVKSDIDQPFLRSCLLLAAFVCQHNRPEQDKKVFSARGNGRRKKRSRDGSTEGDDMAFGSSGPEVELVKSLRPRPFLLERVFSIFVTMVRLNPGPENAFPQERRNASVDVDDLGTHRLYQDMSCLIDTGYLHPVGYKSSVKGEQINFNRAKLWCSLTREEAMVIALRIGVPLENYLL